MRIHSAGISCIVLNHEFLEDVERHEIEDGDDISWVVLELTIELRVELEDMHAVDIKCVLLCLSDLLELLDVQRLLAVSGIIIAVILLVVISAEIHHIIVLSFHEKSQKLLQLIRNIVCVDVGAPEHLGVA